MMEDLRAEMVEPHPGGSKANGAHRAIGGGNKEDTEARSPGVLDHHLISTEKKIQRKKYQVCSNDHSFFDERY